MNSPCNCPLSCKVQGLCAYDEKCRYSHIVYQVRCRLCNYIYIGNTQQKFKERMAQHFNDVQQLVLHGKASDSYAKHFARHFPPDKKPKPLEIRSLSEHTVLWQGNLISLMKTFETLNCQLCMKERLFIVSKFNDKTDSLINSCNEVYDAC